jgi:hypothetical protein
MVRATPPVAFSETPAVMGPPCRRGEHNRSVLGYSADAVVGFEQAGIICPMDPPAS